MSTEKLAKIQEYIEKHYDATKAGNGYWDTGSYDDSFEMGQDVGKRDALFDIAMILGIDVDDPEEMSLD